MAEADAFLFTSLAQSTPWTEGGYVPNGATVFDVLEASTVMKPVAREEARAKTGVRGTPAVLWVGRLDANKDPLAVLEGFERALGSLPDATLTMVFGSDDLIEEVRRRSAGSGRLGERVRLIGPVPYGEIADWYSAADLFVLGSHNEGSGYALIEACACGATPVVTDIAPFRAITGDGAIGIHWPVGDAEACGAALVRAAAQAGDGNRRVVLDHFSASLSWEAVGRRARAVYEAVIARRASREETAAC
jgi:glycosyltransferase involved in cell wall biosynthesis